MSLRAALRPLTEDGARHRLPPASTPRFLVAPTKRWPGLTVDLLPRNQPGARSLALRDNLQQRAEESAIALIAVGDEQQGVLVVADLTVRRR